MDVVLKKKIFVRTGHNQFVEEHGGLGCFVTFPSEMIKSGNFGDLGCYYKICKNCGKVEMQGIRAL
jgi:hypothetical protein